MWRPLPAQHYVPLRKLGVGKCENYIRPESHYLSRVGTSTFSVTARPAIIDLEVTALRPSKLMKPLTERSYPRLSFGIAFGGVRHHAQTPHIVSLLCLCRERSHYRRAAEQCWSERWPRPASSIIKKGSENP